MVQEWTLGARADLPLDGVREVRALVMRGGIRVIGTDDARARVTVSEADSSPVTVRLDDDGVLRIGNGPVSGLRLLASSLPSAKRHRAVVTVTVPRACTVDVNGAVSSSVLVTGLRGDVRAHVGYGRLVLAQLSGTVTADNAKGAIEAMEISGPLRVRSVGGEVVLADISGPVRAETVSGPLSVHARPAPGARLRLETESGPIHLAVAELRDCTVELHAPAGISSPFPELQDGTGHLADVKRTLGIPLWELRAQSASGEIALVRRDAPKG